jgi:lipopolysaccharide biosynthesis glycosyltransferase
MTITLAASVPARHETSVVFACDANYARYAYFAADQIVRLHPDRDFDICICAMNENPLPVASLASHQLRYCRIGAEGVFTGLNLDARRTEAAYLRLALPQAFRGDYRRLLYLDSDVFVQAGDLSRLMQVDLGGRAVGAVRDNTQWRTPDRRPEPFRKVGLPSARYFNSGLLLIDLEIFNAQNLLQQSLDFAQANSGKLIGLDQELFNCVLHGNWAELHPAWNWQYTRATMLFEALEGANIVHFIGAKKPWRHTSGALPLRFRRAYRDFLARHLPDAAPIGEDGLFPHENQSYLRSVFFRHLMAVGRFGSYIGRFEDEWHVL